MASDQEKDNLSTLRKKIDTLDDQILELLSERASVVEVVGKLKHSRDKLHSIIRPGREARMIRRMAELTKRPLSPEAVAHLWRMIISSAINIEEETQVSAVSTPENEECYWLSREYFGPFTAITKHPTAMGVIGDVFERKATVGVVPIWDENAPRPWWVRLIEEECEEEPPLVFARLPFIRVAPSQKSPLIAIGYIVPEQTEDDRSLWVIQADELIPLDTIEPVLRKEVNLPFEMIDHFRQYGTPTMRYYLVEFKGFINNNDERLEKFLKKIRKQVYEQSPVRVRYIGSYATPLVIERE